MTRATTTIASNNSGIVTRLTTLLGLYADWDDLDDRKGWFELLVDLFAQAVCFDLIEPTGLNDL